MLKDSNDIYIYWVKFDEKKKKKKAFVMVSNFLNTEILHIFFLFIFQVKSNYIYKMYVKKKKSVPLFFSEDPHNILIGN